MNKIGRSVCNIVIIGPPGSGKGTISKKLISAFNFNHVSTGDIFRDNIARGTPIGIEVKQIVNSGGLVPDDIVLKLVVDSHKKIVSLNPDARILFDGFPRTLYQAESLAIAQVPVSSVLLIDVPFSTIVTRLSGRWIHAPSGRTYAYDYNPPKKIGFDDISGEPLIRRADDHPDAVQDRLNKYSTLTTPVCDYYKSQNLLRAFPGTESKVIYEDVSKYLESKYGFL